MINKNISKNGFSRARLLFVALATMLMFVTMALYPLISSAAPTSEFNQEITLGALAPDIRDSNADPVANPSISFTPVQATFGCLTGASAPWAILGTNSERLYIDNPSAAPDGWTLNLEATDPDATWEHTTDSAHQYDYRDPGNSGCDNSNANGFAGQMTVDPTGDTLDVSQDPSAVTAHCETLDGISCTADNITAGIVDSFDDTITSIKLMEASDQADSVGRWYLTGVFVRQTIPAGQENGEYTIDMTLSAYQL